MSSRINTILIIGATAGIGEAFTRCFHAMGKKVIGTRCNQNKLNDAASELPGLETRRFDILDLAALSTNINGILEGFPSLDTVLITAETQLCHNLFDPSSATPEDISAHASHPALVATRSSAS
ncbi:hypothetical protein AAE478_001213 [Parahypoxylon ruwenzoriense]